MKYYSTQRLDVPDAYPKPEGNNILNIVNFGDRKFCPEISRCAWGYIEYEKPLKAFFVNQYDLISEQKEETFADEYVFSVIYGKGTKTVRYFEVGVFETKELAKTAMMEHYKKTSKRGNFHYMLIKNTFEKMYGSTVRVSYFPEWYTKYTAAELKQFAT